MDEQGTNGRPIGRGAVAAAALGAAGLALCAGGARAQDALGDGRALDSNLQQGSGGRNSYGFESRLPEQVRFNNALVTGNVPGGFSFRESVGYFATDDFRGELGSNDTFGFVRDSFYSAAPLAGLRGLEALREQASFAMDETYFNDGLLPVLLRAGAGASGAQEADALEAERANRAGAFVDPFRMRPRSLRSGSDRLVNERLAARPVAYYTPEGALEAMLISASPLRGVVTEQTLTDELLLELGAQTAAPDQVSDFVFGGATNAPLGGNEGYEEMVARMRRDFNERHAPAPEGVETPEGAPAPPGSEGFEEMDANLDRLRRTLLGVEPARTEEQPGAPTGRTAPEEIAREILRMSRGASEEKVSRLYPPVGPERDLFTENVQAGQRLLTERRWFDAEERFSSALRLRPGAPMAAVGRIHAQVGAGLFLSAGVNLDRLLRTNPELIGARYEEVLLPRDERLRSIEQRLRVNMRQDTDMGRSSALLLAYMGWQHSDRAMLEDGLAAMERIDAARGGGGDALLVALRAGWRLE